MTSQKPTILHVIDTTGPGGAETVFLQLAAACNQNGYHSIAVIRGPGWVEEQLKKLDVEYRIFDCKGSFNVRFLWSVIQLVRANNVQVIQSHLLGSNVYSSLAGLLTRRRVIVTFHGHVDISPTERFRTAKLLLVRMGANRIVCVTAALMKVIMEMGDSRLLKKSIVIANGVDITQLVVLPIRQLPNGKDNPLIFGMLGNIRTAKNYFLAVDFAELLVVAGYNISLKIAGDDSKKLASDLKLYVKNKRLDHIIEFYGFIDDVPRFFNSCDFFVMTSSTEGHPLALTQALAAGLPVVTTPSGVEEIIENGVTGFISSNHDKQKLYNLVKSCIDLDDEKMKEVQLAGRNLAVSRYSLSAMCAEYFNIYATTK